MDYRSYLTFTIRRASAVLAHEIEVCGAGFLSNSPIDYIIDDHATWRLRRHLAWDLDDAFRVSKPEERYLCIADRCHERTPQERKLFRR